MRPLRRPKEEQSTQPLSRSENKSLARKLGIDETRDQDNLFRIARLMRDEWRRERYRRLRS
jgi:hypothetical protein